MLRFYEVRAQFTNPKRRRSCRFRASRPRCVLRHVFADVSSQDFVDQCLVPNTLAARFLAELIEHTWIDTNRDELAGFISKGRPTHPPHGLQLLCRRIGNVREVNLSRRTPRARGGSPTAR